MSFFSTPRLLERIFGSRHLFNKKKQDNGEEIQAGMELETGTDDEEEEGTQEYQFYSLEPEPQENPGAAEDVPEEDDIEYEVVEREIHPSKIICPDCGGITLEGLDFCDKCGGLL